MPKEMTTLEKAKLEITLSRFDFEKVHKSMKQMNWTWATSRGYSVPDIEELKSTAERLLTQSFECHNMSTGGLEAEWDGQYFTLRFVVGDSNSYIDGEEEFSKRDSGSDSNPKKSTNAIASLELSEEKEL